MCNIGMSIIIDALPGCRDGVLQILKEIRDYVSEEEGILAWIVHEVRDSSDRLLVYEWYVDSTALDHHLNSNMVRVALKKMRALIRNEPEIIFLNNFMVGKVPK